MKKEYIFQVPIGETQDLISISMTMVSIHNCLMYSRNEEEREAWRERWTDFQIRHIAEIDKLKEKFGDKEIFSNPNLIVTGTHFDVHTNRIKLFMDVISEEDAL